jgi:hypothetical protein
VDIQEQSDPPLGDPGAEELMDLGIDPAFMLAVGFLEGGGREVQVAPSAPPSLHPLSFGAAVEGTVFAELKRMAIGIGAALDDHAPENAKDGQARL